MTNPTEDPRPDPARSALSRRTVVAGAAWAVPVIAFSAAAPAMAVSPWHMALTGTGWGSVLRCDEITGVTFCPTQLGNPAPAGHTIRVTLATGLEFVGGGQTRDIPTDSSTRVDLGQGGHEPWHRNVR